MFKVYYYNKILIFSKNQIDDLSFTKIHYLNEDKIKNELNLFLNNETDKNLNIFGKHYNDIPDLLQKYFKIINAAGGVVFNENNEFIYLKRLGYYDLPKGKIELGESPEDAAIREVSEECGILLDDLTIIDKIDEVFHIYFLNDRFILKKTYWFRMKFNSNYQLKPQVEENITEIGWISVNRVDEFIKYTYLSLREMIRKAITQLEH